MRFGHSVKPSYNETSQHQEDVCKQLLLAATSVAENQELVGIEFQHVSTCYLNLESRSVFALSFLQSLHAVGRTHGASCIFKQRILVQNTQKAVTSLDLLSIGEGGMGIVFSVLSVWDLSMDYCHRGSASLVGWWRACGCWLRAVGYCLLGICWWLLAGFWQ